MGDSTSSAVPATGVSSTLNPAAVMDSFFSAMKQGAAFVYHEVVAAEENVTMWVADNPQIKLLLDDAVALGTAYLTAHGIPVMAIEVAGSAVLGALKSMAADDATITSGSGVVAA